MGFIEELNATIRTTLNIGVLENPSDVRDLYPQVRIIERYDPAFFEGLEEMYKSAKEFGEMCRPYTIERHKKAEEERYSMDFYQKDEKYWELMKEALKRGFLTAMAPGETFNGCCMKSFTSLFLMLEEVCASDPGIGVSIGDHWLGMLPILLSGRIDLWYDEILSKQLKGDPCLVAYAITEPGGGSDAEDEDFYKMASKYLTGHAEKTKGGYILNVQKKFTTNGSVSSYVTVLAPLDTKNPLETSCFFLTPTNAEGFSFGRNEEKMGQRGHPATETFWDNVFVPEKYLLSPVGTGMYIGGTATLAVSRAGVGAIGTGIARGVYERFLDYARNTKVNGHMLIDENDIQIALADMYRRWMFAHNAWINSGLMFDSLFAPYLEIVNRLIPKNIFNIGREIVFNPLIEKILSGILGAIQGSPQFKQLLYNIMYGYVLPNDYIGKLLGLSSIAKPTSGDMAVANAVEALNLIGPRYSVHRQGIEKLFCDGKLNQIYEGANQVNLIAVYKELCRRSKGFFDIPTAEVL